MFALFFINFQDMFRTFSASMFALIFSQIVDGNRLQNDSKKYPGNHQKSVLFAILSEGRLLDAFWPPFGSLWPPFWLPLAPFCRHLGHFGRPFGTNRLTFGTLWSTFAHLRDPFSRFWVSWPHFSSLFLWFRRKSNKI